MFRTTVPLCSRSWINENINVNKYIIRLFLPTTILHPIPFPAFCPALCLFSFAKPTVNIKLPKPQSGGGVSTFLKHMHFQFLFCSVIKSSICTGHREASTHGLSESRLLPHATSWPNLKINKYVFKNHFLLFYCRRVNRSKQYLDNTLWISLQTHQFEFT